jgi:CheY-like chemotaxis protein
MLTDQKPRVLVVEDSPNWREMFGFLLASEGYDVDVAVSLNDGLRMLDANLYQLVVVDLQLSTPDEVDSAGLGMILLDRLANSRPKVPAIAVTGWDRVSPGTPRKLFKSYDIYDFFWKSDFDANEFRRAAAECLKPIQPHALEVKIEGDKK